MADKKLLWRDRPENKERVDRKDKEWRQRNRDLVLAIKRKSNRKNIAHHKKYLFQHKEKIASQTREAHTFRRMTCLYHYGRGNPFCLCCGEREIKFLCIDHINNDGAQHRKTLSKNGKGGNIFVWLIRNNFPEGFQVLCYNCNITKSLYNGCPHKING